MNRTDLITALKTVIPGVAKGDVLFTGADSFVFRNGLIQSYNDDISVTYPLDTGINGAVKALELFKVLDKMSGSEVDLTISDNSLLVTDGVTELSMQLIEYDIEDLLNDLSINELDWKNLPGRFMEALRLCLPSVSCNVIHGGLTGIHCHGSDVVSSDNFRAMLVTLDGDLGETFTLPGGAVRELLKLDDLEQYAVTESWGHFMSSGGAVFSTRLIASEFPYENLKNMFPSDDEMGEIYELPEGLELALERADILSYQDSGLNYINVKPKGKFLIVTGERQYGSIKEKVKLGKRSWPEGVSININPRYFISIVKMTKTFYTSNKLVYFYGDNFKHVIATIES